MFENVDHIESLSDDDYKKIIEILKNKDQYPGDYKELLRKIIEYSSKVNDKI